MHKNGKDAVFMHSCFIAKIVLSFYMEAADD
jgi:hypothetical protein